MKGKNLAIMTRWLMGMLALAWLLGALPLAPSPIGDAQAGFFDKVKNPGGKAQAPSAPSPPSSGSEQKGSGFFKTVKQPAAPSTPPAPKVAAPPASSYTPLHQPKAGFLGPAKNGAVSSVVVPRAPRQGGVVYSQRNEGWKRSAGVLGVVKEPPKSGWTSRGYFETLRRELESRQHSHGHYWYYPYDYTYYRWLRYHVMPIYVSPYYYGYPYAYPGYVYPGYQFYYVIPPTIIIQQPNDYAEPRDWVAGEDYIPYMTWPSDDLMEARHDIEQAWRDERIKLIDRHLDPDHEIDCYLRDEYTHSLTAEEFRQLTLDAFSSMDTESFELTSVRYVSTSDWARVKGKHVFTDPNDERTVVYVSYLMRRIESESGRWRWVIWEVRQSPQAY